MADPWLSIVGLGEDGPAGLPAASRTALAGAEVVFGGPRHLALAGAGDRGREWPVPFAIAPLLACRGRAVAALCSGDPFWFGAGSMLAEALEPGEWVAHPAPSAFQLAASRLGWRMEGTGCHGLHAAPFARLRPHLHEGARLICTLRDGGAAGELARWLTEQGFGASDLWILEALGGARERVRSTRAETFALHDAAAPVAMAILARGQGLSRAPGLRDALFAHDGPITKAPVRALTLSALGPRPGERLWDLGAGSGSVSVEWCLAGGRASAVERRADRAANVRANAAAFGVDHRLTVVEGPGLEALPALPPADAVFVGGGADAALMAALWDRLRPGARLVANAVTLETDALLSDLHARHGGTLLRIDLAQAAPLGRSRGWDAARTVTQWSAVR